MAKKVKRRLPKSWEVVQGSYGTDGTPANFSIHHSYNTLKKALKGWEELRAILGQHTPAFCITQRNYISLKGASYI